MEFWWVIDLHRLTYLLKIFWLDFRNIRHLKSVQWSIIRVVKGLKYRCGICQISYLLKNWVWKKSDQAPSHGQQSYGLPVSHEIQKIVIISFACRLPNKICSHFSRWISDQLRWKLVYYSLWHSKETYRALSWI